MALSTGYLMSTGGGPALLSIDPLVDDCDPPKSPLEVPDGNDDQVRVNPDWLVQVTGVKPVPQAHRKNPANGTRIITFVNGLRMCLTPQMLAADAVRRSDRLDDTAPSRTSCGRSGLQSNPRSTPMRMSVRHTRQTPGGGFGQLTRTVTRRVPSIHVIYRREPEAR